MWKSNRWLPSTSEYPFISCFLFVRFLDHFFISIYGSSKVSEGSTHGSNTGHLGLIRSYLSSIHVLSWPWFSQEDKKGMWNDISYSWYRTEYCNIQVRIRPYRYPYYELFHKRSYIKLVRTNLNYQNKYRRNLSGIIRGNGCIERERNILLKAVK